MPMMIVHALAMLIIYDAKNKVLRINILVYSHWSMVLWTAGVVYTCNWSLLKTCVALMFVWHLVLIAMNMWSTIVGNDVDSSWSNMIAII